MLKEVGLLPRSLSCHLLRFHFISVPVPQLFTHSTYYESPTFLSLISLYEVTAPDFPR
jgi:hypothetical protein